MICTIAPSHAYYADSRITLNFAANACKVKVKARVNEVKKSESELGIFQDVAQQLKAQLRALPVQGAWPAGTTGPLIGPDGSPLAAGASPAEYQAALQAQHMQHISLDQVLAVFYQEVLSLRLQHLHRPRRRQPNSEKSCKIKSSTSSLSFYVPTRKAMTTHWNGKRRRGGILNNISISSSLRESVAGLPLQEAM